jgi:hypothetical protein
VADVGWVPGLLRAMLPLAVIRCDESSPEPCMENLRGEDRRMLGSCPCGANDA